MFHKKTYSITFNCFNCIWENVLKMIFEWPGLSWKWRQISWKSVKEIGGVGWTVTAKTTKKSISVTAQPSGLIYIFQAIKLFNIYPLLLKPQKIYLPNGLANRADININAEIGENLSIYISIGGLGWAVAAKTARKCIERICRFDVAVEKRKN